MTTTKSYSESSRMKSLFGLSLKRNLPIALACLIALFLIVMLPYFSFSPSHDYLLDNPSVSPEQQTQLIIKHYQQIFYLGAYLNEVQPIMVTIVLAALAVFTAIYNGSYTQSKKQTDFYHSLPIRRPHLLVTNMLSSSLAVLVPFVAVILITSAAQIVMYSSFNCFTSYYFGFLISDLLAQIIGFLVVYAFTTFISVQVGTIFDTLAITGVLGILPIALYVIPGSFWNYYTYGAQFDSFERCSLLSPFTFLFDRFVTMDYYSDITTVNLKALGIAAALWAVIGIVLLIASIVLYNKRKSEIAEQTAPNDVLQMISKAFAGFCGASLFLAIFMDRVLAVRLLGIFFGAILIGTIAELVFGRGLRTLRKSLRGIVITALGLCFVSLALFFDWSGYESKVPAPEAVQSVTINTRGRFNDQYDGEDVITLTDPTTIAILTGTHQTAVDRYKESDTSKEDLYSLNDFNYNNLVLEYHMTNGQTMKRTYDVLHRDASASLVALEAQDDFIEAMHPVFPMTEDKLRKITVSNRVFPQINHTLMPTAAQSKELLEALRLDLLNEPLAEITNPSESAVGYINLSYKVLEEQLGRRRNYYANYDKDRVCDILITPTYTNTLSWLKKYDLMQYMAMPETIEKAYVVSSEWASYYSDNQINTISAYQDYRGEEYPYIAKALEEASLSGSNKEDLAFIVVTDPAEMQHMLDKARNQVFIEAPKDTPASADHVLVLFQNEGRVSSYSYLAVKDLPASAAAQLDTLYREIDDKPYGVTYER
ncbi:DUF6449 domain-containing protein [Oscillospiraceae bacterium MB08-C2-2]|nr:DUF6449 domain-containing protein [Oscillospiraceae bacterium MB08-C2-2]